MTKSEKEKTGIYREKSVKENPRLRRMLNVNNGAFIKALLKFKLLRDTRIQTRLLVSFLVLSFVPLLVSGAISWQKSSGALQSKISASSIQVMKQLSVNLGSEMTSLSSLITELASNDIVQKGMQEYMAADEVDKYGINGSIIQLMIDKFTNMGNIKYEAIIFDDANAIVNGIQVDLASDFYRGIVKEASESNGLPIWKVVEGNSSSDLLAYAKKIKSRTSMTDMGVILVVIDSKQLSDKFLDLDIGEGSDIFVIDSKGFVVSSVSKDIPFGKAYGEAGVAEKIAGKDTADYFMYGGKEMVAYSPIKGTGWTVVGTIPTSYLNAESNNIRNAIILICVICFLLALVLSYIISMSISDPLNKLVKAMRQAKEGDLTPNTSEKRRDEIGEVANNFNDMMGNIRQLLSRVHDASQDVLGNSEKIATSSQRSYSSAEQVALSIQEIAKGASQQSLDATESVNNMNSLSEGFEKVAADMDRVSGVVSDTKQLSGNALVTVESLDGKARQTTEVSERIIGDINELDGDMKQIKGIVKVMVELAEQTNLLSLNASIEAARAGEAGLGFAVVADEVKKLAQRSREASVSINDIIGKIQKKTEETVSAANNASSIVKEQMDAVRDTDRAFKTVYEAMEGISRYISNVMASVAASETSRSRTMASIESMSAVTQQSAASVQEVYASTEEQMAGSEELANLAKSLNEMASVLDREIGQFRF